MRVHGQLRQWPTVPERSEFFTWPRQTAEPSLFPSRKSGSGPRTRIRIGRIRVTIWENHHEEKGKWFSMTVSRSYKQGNDWKSASSFGRDDLLPLGEALRQAFHWLCIREQQKGNASGQSGEGMGLTEAPRTGHPLLADQAVATRGKRCFLFQANRD